MNYADVLEASFAAKEDNFVITQNEQSVEPPSRRATSAMHLGTGQCLVGFKSKTQDRGGPSTNGYCWHDLFRHCAIAEGYPVPSRPSQQRGVEIPFSMMAALVCAERVTPFSGNLIVKGLSTLLFPTYYEEGCMFWHLIYNEDGTCIPFTDNRIPLPSETDPTVEQLRSEDINNARHIVGWAAQVRNNTGQTSSHC